MQEGPGQFEALTAIALLAFVDLDAQVLEAGLGGRLDATNAVRSEVQVLTSVGLDHQSWLGDTVEEIAGEKLAVVEEGGTLVLAPGLPDTVRALARGIAQERSARVVEATAIAPSALRDPRAAGGFQRQNLGVALAAARALLETLPGGADRPTDAQMLAAAEARLPLRGRLEPVGHEPLVVVDAAHNVQAAECLIEAFDDLAGDRADRRGRCAPRRQGPGRGAERPGASLCAHGGDDDRKPPFPERAAGGRGRRGRGARGGARGGRPVRRRPGLGAGGSWRGRPGDRHHVAGAGARGAGRCGRTVPVLRGRDGRVRRPRLRSWGPRGVSHPTRGRGPRELWLRSRSR